MEGLGISIPTLITQIVSFIILLVLLCVFAYKPIMKMMDERARRIKDSLEQAEAVKQQSVTAEAELKKQIEQVNREGQDRIERAIKAGEEVKLKAEADAKKEAETLLTRARAEIRQERDEAIGDVRKEFADLTVLAAGKVIGKSLDKADHRELIEKVLQESANQEKE